MPEIKIPNLQAVFGGNKITDNNTNSSGKAIGNLPDELVKEDNFEKIVNININDLIEFKEHIFNEISTDDFEDLVKSIEQNGMIEPIIVRPTDDDKYEILAGHNRTRACKELGMQTIRATIKDVDDDKAKLIMIDTNINRRKKLLPSELMKAYTMKMEILKKEKMGQAVPETDSITETREKLAETENVSGRQISRYLRLNKLIPELLRCVDKDILPFLVGVELSYLSEQEQNLLLNILNDNPTIKISVKQAETLKENKSHITEDFILEILNKRKTKEKFTGKVKPVIVKKYKDKFKNDEEFIKLVEKLLEQYFSSDKDLSDIS